MKLFIHIGSPIINSPQEHFFRLLDIDRKNFDKFDFEIPKNMQNRGFGKKGMKFAFLARELAENDPGNTVIEKIIENYLPSLLKQNGESYGILSDSQRVDILNKWQAINSEIASKYLNNRYPFSEPLPSVNNIEPAIEPEDVAKALMEALYNLQFPPVNRLRGKKIAVFGFGRSGKLTIKYLEKNYPNAIKFIIDDNKPQKKYKSYPICTTKEFIKKHQYSVDTVVYGAFQRLNPKLLKNLLIPKMRLDGIY